MSIPSEPDAPVEPTVQERMTAVAALESSVRALVLVVSELAAQMRADRKTAATERKENRRSRRTVRWLVVSVILDVLLSVGLASVALQATSASDKARSAQVATRQAGIANCEANNGFRQNNAALWGYIVGLFPPHPNPQLHTIVTNIQGLAAKAFVQRDCLKANP